VIWCPKLSQLRYAENSSRLNSLWLGTVWNVLMFPGIAWHYGKQYIHANILTIMFGWIPTLIFAVVQLLRNFSNGVMGNLSAVTEKEHEEMLRHFGLKPTDDD
jgi:uncharacterized membrane protein YqaE (UPF0057 family)